MKKSFDVYLLPHVVQELNKRGQLNVIRIYTDELEVGKKKSRFGYEGDLWYIPEAGRYYNEDKNIFIFQDNTARKQNGNIGIDLIAPCKYSEATGEKIPASKIPKWAARTWVEVQAVAYPKRVQEMTETDITNLGFEITGEDNGFTTYTLGDNSYTTNLGLKSVFKQWWNDNMGGWRLINKLGHPCEYLAYPFSSEQELRDIEFLELPKKIQPNPYCMVYSIKKTKLF